MIRKNQDSRLVLVECGDTFVLDLPFRYYGNKDSWEIPEGFATDLASVPRFFWGILPPFGRYSRAAVVHDYLYTTGAVSRVDADGVFLRIMKERGVSRLTRYTMWTAVRAFGWLYWKHGRRNLESKFSNRRDDSPGTGK